MNAIVTGANRGIGRAVAEGLAADGANVVLACRDLAAGQDAARAIGVRAEARALDVTDPASIAAFVAGVGRVDVLVNNAGIALDGFGPEVVDATLATNLFGVMDLTDALASRLGESAVVVNVSSGLADLFVYAPPIRARFRDPGLDRTGLRALVGEFSAAVRRGTWTRDGWPTSAYRVSKAGLNAWTRLLARERPTWRVNAVCPGWVATRMGGDEAPRSVEEGAAGVLWAARLGPGGPTGGFFRDGLPAEADDG